MNLWKRAYLHTIRKKGKTTLMFFILLISSTLILTCLAIQSATDTAALNIRKSLMGSFTVNAKHMDSQLMDSAVTGILNTEGLTSNYNLRSYFEAVYYSTDGQALKITDDGAKEVPEGYEHAGKIVSNTHSDADTYFTKAGFRLVEGHPITEEDSHAVLVHEEFARRNKLSLGDYLILAAAGDINRQVKVKIVGIFTNTLPQDAEGMVPSYDLYENIAFSDNEVYSELYFGDGTGHYQYGDFYVNDPAKLDTIISKVKSIPEINWGDCIITKCDTDYQNAKSALEALQSLVTTIICVLIAASIVIFVLVLSLWMRSRIYETGVLLAMGFNKGNILMQHMAESLLIACFAFAVTYGTSSWMAQSVGDNLLQQAAAKDQATVIDLTGEALDDQAEDKSFSLTSIVINVSMSDLLHEYVIGTGLILLSVLLADLPVMRMKPKEILTRMS